VAVIQEDVALVQRGGQLGGVVAGHELQVQDVRRRPLYAQHLVGGAADGGNVGVDNPCRRGRLTGEHGPIAGRNLHQSFQSRVERFVGHGSAPMVPSKIGRRKQKMRRTTLMASWTLRHPGFYLFLVDNQPPPAVMIVQPSRVSPERPTGGAVPFPRPSKPTWPHR